MPCRRKAVAVPYADQGVPLLRDRSLCTGLDSHHRLRVSHLASSTHTCSNALQLKEVWIQRSWVRSSLMVDLEATTLKIAPWMAKNLCFVSFAIGLVPCAPFVKAVCLVPHSSLEPWAKAVCLVSKGNIHDRTGYVMTDKIELYNRLCQRRNGRPSND